MRLCSSARAQCHSRPFARAPLFSRAACPCPACACGAGSSARGLGSVRWIFRAALELSRALAQMPAPPGDMHGSWACDIVWAASGGVPTRFVDTWEASCERRLGAVPAYRVAATRMLIYGLPAWEGHWVALAAQMAITIRQQTDSSPAEVKFYRLGFADAPPGPRLGGRYSAESLRIAAPAGSSAGSPAAPPAPPAPQSHPRVLTGPNAPAGFSAAAPGSAGAPPLPSSHPLVLTGPNAGFSAAEPDSAGAPAGFSAAALGSAGAPAGFSAGASRVPNRARAARSQPPPPPRRDVVDLTPGAMVPLLCGDHQVKIRRCSIKANPGETHVWVALRFWRVEGVPQLEGKELDGHITLCYIPLTPYWSMKWETAVDGMKRLLHKTLLDQYSQNRFWARFHVSECNEDRYGIADILADSPLFEFCHALVHAGEQKVILAPLAPFAKRTQFHASFRVWRGRARADGEELEDEPEWLPKLD